MSGRRDVWNEVDVEMAGCRVAVVCPVPAFVGGSGIPLAPLSRRQQAVSPRSGAAVGTGIKHSVKGRTADGGSARG